MRIQRGTHKSPVSGVVELWPPVQDAFELELSPRAETVQTFVMTRAAEGSWQRINAHLGGESGAFFWIGGPAGSGKTHFLNYIIALGDRAGALNVSNMRRVICGFEVAGRVDSAELEIYTLESLAQEISGSQKAAPMWREMRGAGALKVAMEQARRVGIREVIVAIDFGRSTPDSEEYLAVLSGVAAECRHVRLTVIAAGRAQAAKFAVPLEVAPADVSEQMRVGLGRARRLTADDRRIGELYHGIDCDGMEPSAIFPFHPAAAAAIRAISDGTTASIAQLAREALATALEDGAVSSHSRQPHASLFYSRQPHASRSGRLLYQADLNESSIIQTRIRSALGESGDVALRLARDSVSHFHGNQKELARQIVATLVIERICHPQRRLAISELEARVPMLAEGSTGASSTPLVAEMLRTISSRTAGVISVDSDGAIFDPANAEAPEVAGFDAALALLKRFDPSLGPVRDRRELETARKRIGAAMSDAIEAANRTREILKAGLAEARIDLPEAHRNVIESFIALAEKGTAALVELNSDPIRRAAAIETISSYENLAAAAAVVPRMRAMREYLAGTGLRVALEEDPSKDRQILTLETECQLLAAELEPRVLANAPRNLDALEARFQKFKWTYVQNYRNAHSVWRAEMNRVALLADDARRHFDALKRLNQIAALGPPEGDELESRIVVHGARISRCDFEGALQPEISPRCPGCNYLLGDQSPRAELTDLLDLLRRALNLKLEALSQSTVGRIIREHDHSRRLEGFLKIIQASQTDALVRVLNEKLARYLAQLLDENLAAGEPPASEPPHRPLNAIARPPFKNSSGKLRSAARIDRPDKSRT
ncbi:MAG TPA: hypothetical protein VIX12_03795 [Candidatus Binataceae bacterium]